MFSMLIEDNDSHFTYTQFLARPPTEAVPSNTPMVMNITLPVNNSEPASTTIIKPTGNTAPNTNLDKPIGSQSRCKRELFVYMEYDKKSYWSARYILGNLYSSQHRKQIHIRNICRVFCTSSCRNCLCCFYWAFKR